MEKTLHQKLQYIQLNLKAKKGKINSFGGYKYRNLEDIFEAVKPLLKETDCIVTASDEIVSVNGFNYICATATLTSSIEDIHKRIPSISVTGWARESVNKKGMDDSQITGSTSSYARKHAFNGLFAIDDTADADSMDNRPETLITGKAVKPGHITVDQNLKLERLSRNTKFSSSNNVNGVSMQEQVRTFINSNPTIKEADEKIAKLNTIIKEVK